MSITENKKSSLKNKLDVQAPKKEWEDVATQRAKRFAEKRRIAAKMAEKARKAALKNRQPIGPTITPIFPEAKNLKEKIKSKVERILKSAKKK